MKARLRATCRAGTIASALLAAHAAAAGAGPAPRALPFPEEPQSLETVERGIEAIGFVDGKLVYLPSSGSLAVRVGFAPGGKSREAVFGSLLAQTRHEIPGEGRGKGRYVATWQAGGRALVLDGEHVAVVEADLASLKQILVRTILWDRVRPAADRGGEATRSETAELRAAFKRAMMAAPRHTFVGAAPLPAEWKWTTKPAYLVGTRLKGFPLVVLECDGEEPSACEVTRACRLPAGLPSEATGMALSAKRRLLIVSGRQELHGFTLGSCFAGSKAVGTWTVPPRIKGVTSIHVDQDDRLWVGAGAPDDWLNASIYYWDAAQW